MAHQSSPTIPPTVPPIAPTGRGDAVVRWIALLMILEALSLAVASSLHLAGLVHGRASSFDGTDAGIAEVLIGVVLAGAAVVMLRAPHRARRVGLAATAFAIVGFLIGVGESARGGHAPDIAYHLTLLPVFIVSLVVLWRRPARPPEP